MISYFQKNSTTRLPALVLIALIIWIPSWLLHPLDFQKEELDWLITGKALWQGKLVYKDFWVYLEPIPSSIYALVHGIFGSSFMALRGLALLVCIFATWQFDNICRQYDVFNDRNYVPAFLFICWISSQDLFRLFSPALLALCFLMVCLELSFKHIRHGIRQDDMLILGFSIGMASLCFRSASVFILFPILLFVLYSGTSFREYLLLIFGFVFPLILCFLFFYWHDAGTDYYRFFILPFGNSPIPRPTISWAGWSALLAISSAWVVIAAIRTLSIRSYVTHQLNCQIGFLVWALLTIFALWLDGQWHIWIVVLATPAAAAFLALFFQSFKKKWQSNFIFYAFVCMIAATQWANFTHPVWKSMAQTAESKIEPAPSFFKYQNKKILVLADIPACYIHNSIATPYFYWPDFNKKVHSLTPFDYSNKWQLYQDFNQDMPDLVYDPNQIFAKLLLGMPLLENRFERMPNRIYQLKNSK